MTPATEWISVNDSLPSIGTRCNLMVGKIIMTEIYTLSVCEPEYLDDDDIYFWNHTDIRKCLDIKRGQFWCEVRS